MAKQRKPAVLNEGHRDILRKLRKACFETNQYLEQCKACHIDVDREIDENNQQAKIAEAIQRMFFPNQP